MCFCCCVRCVSIMSEYISVCLGARGSVCVRDFVVFWNLSFGTEALYACEGGSLCFLGYLCLCTSKSQGFETCPRVDFPV